MRAEQAASRCVCGHTGDGPHSQHFDTALVKGHGECRMCDCTRFTWRNWTRYGERLARLIQRERERQKEAEPCRS